VIAWTIEVSNYDPLQIIEKTNGRMAEDNQWIEIIYKNKEEAINIYFTKLAKML